MVDVLIEPEALAELARRTGVPVAQLADRHAYAIERAVRLKHRRAGAEPGGIVRLGLADLDAPD